MFEHGYMPTAEFRSRKSSDMFDKRRCRQDIWFHFHEGTQRYHDPLGAGIDEGRESSREHFETFRYVRVRYLLGGILRSSDVHVDGLAQT